MQLLREFHYVRVKRKKKKVRSAEDQRILDSISAEGVKELNQHKRGEIELQDAFEMLDELRGELKAENE